MRAEHWDSTADEYHASEGVSNSALSVFLDSPAKYRMRFVKGVKVAPTAAMDIGTAAHSLCLDVARESEELVVIPRDALTSNGQRRGKAWEQFVEENPGKTLLRPPEYEAARSMADAIRMHPIAKEILDGRAEYNLRGVHEPTGLMWRCRVDSFGESIDWDLKTTPSVKADAFRKSVVNFGYHRQHYIYRRLIASHTGEECRPFRFACVEKDPPHDVQVFELDREFEALAQREVEEGMARLAECFRSSDWRLPGSDQVQELSPPKWAKRDKDVGAWSRELVAWLDEETIQETQT